MSDSELIKAATGKYWAPIASELGGLTRLTTRIYEELIAIGESSAPSLMASLMQTGTRTIQTRLQEARKVGRVKQLCFLGGLATPLSFLPLSPRFRQGSSVRNRSKP